MLELATQSNVYGSLYVVFSEGGCLSTQSTPPVSAPGYIHIIAIISYNASAIQCRGWEDNGLHICIVFPSLHVHVHAHAVGEWPTTPSPIPIVQSSLTTKKKSNLDLWHPV